VLQSQSVHISKVPRGTLLGEMHEWYSDFRVSVNEMSVKVGKAKEGLNFLDFLGFG